MTLRSVAIGTAIICAVAVIYAQTTPQTPVFRANADAVSVDVSVSKGNNPVAGLTAADFVLLDNGVRQDVEAEPLTIQPIDVTFVFGASLDQDRDQLARSATNVKRLAAMLHPTDRLRIVVFGDSVQELVPMQPANAALADAPRIKSRGSALNDAVFYALAWPVSPDRRHMVVVFTNGFDTWDSTVSANRVPEIASRADAVLHVVLFEAPSIGSKTSMTGATAGRSTESAVFVGPFPELLAKWKDSVNALTQAAERTGGTSRYFTKDVDAFQQILDDFRSSYLLRYTPRGVARPGWHDISVKIGRPGSFTVRARKGYEGGSAPQRN